MGFVLKLHESGMEAGDSVCVHRNGRLMRSRPNDGVASLEALRRSGEEPLPLSQRAVRAAKTKVQIQER
jgi:hypothetical protein